VRPSALAVFRLMTSSNLVGCSTGRSPGLAPLEDLIDEGRGGDGPELAAHGAACRPAEDLAKSGLGRIPWGTRTEGQADGVPRFGIAKDDPA
jgi:hypothetical protein